MCRCLFTRSMSGKATSHSGRAWAGPGPAQPWAWAGPAAAWYFALALYILDIPFFFVGGEYFFVYVWYMFGTIFGNLSIPLKSDNLSFSGWNVANMSFGLGALVRRSDLGVGNKKIKQ